MLNAQSVTAECCSQDVLISNYVAVLKMWKYCNFHAYLCVLDEAMCVCKMKPRGHWKIIFLSLELTYC